MPPLLQSLLARYRGMSWGQRGYALIVLTAITTAGIAAWNDGRARTFERMHRRISAAGARSTRSVTVVADPEEAYFLALLGDFSAVDLNGVIGNGPNCTVDAAILRDLRHYPQLTTLRLSHASLKSADFHQIWELENLVRLNLAFNELTDADLAGVEKLENLTNLELQFTPLTDASVPRLAKLPGLSSLDITGTDISSEGAERLRQAYSLIQSAPSTQVTHRPAPSSRFRAAVIRLLPTNTYGPDTRNGANWMRLLLRPENWKGREQDIPLLADLTDVEAVYIQRMPLSPELLSALAALPKVHLLSISDLPADDGDLARFSRCRNLRTLRLSGMLLDEGFMTSLAQLESLESLSIYNCKLTTGACRAIADVKSVRSLHLRQLEVSPAEFTTLLWQLEVSPQLRLLDLAAVPIDNESVSLLARLTQLVSLGLGSPDIDDNAVPELCTFTHLQQLDVTQTRITLPSPGISTSGATQLEAALLPANIRVVHPKGKTSIFPLNLADLTAKAKAEAAAALTAKAIPGAKGSAKSDKPPPQ
ncbi:MAG: hypothetical protein ACR2FY_12520 [Pirellulaceae bacterium]